MKSLFFGVLSLLSLSSSYAAVSVSSVELDLSQKSLLFAVGHGGGCGTHQYNLVVKDCRETFPVSCKAELEHFSNDRCRAMIYGTVAFSLQEQGLNASKYKGALLNVEVRDRTTGETSEVSVQLP